MKSGEISPPPPAPPRAVRRTGRVEKSKKRKSGHKQHKRPETDREKGDQDGEGAGPNGRGSVVDIVV